VEGISLPHFKFIQNREPSNKLMYVDKGSPTREPRPLNGEKKISPTKDTGKLYPRAKE
jgi:hypothetical protein